MLFRSLHCQLTRQRCSSLLRTPSANGSELESNGRSDPDQRERGVPSQGVKRSGIYLQYFLWDQLCSKSSPKSPPPPPPVTCLNMSECAKCTHRCPYSTPFSPLPPLRGELPLQSTATSNICSSFANYPSRLPVPCAALIK